MFFSTYNAKPNTDLRELLLQISIGCGEYNGGDGYLDVKNQVLLLESLLREKKDELKRLEAVDEEKNRLFASVVSMGMTVDEAIELLRKRQ